MNPIDSAPDRRALQTASEVPPAPEPGLPPAEPDEGPASPVIPNDLVYGRGSDRLVRPRRPRGQLAPSPRLAKAPGSVAGLALPHERDESPEPGRVVPDAAMVQAGHDLASGMVDTDMRATPGLDAERRSSLVPGPAGRAPSSGG